MSKIKKTTIWLLVSVKQTSRESYGLHSLTPTISLYGVRKRRMETKTVKMKCEKCLIWKHSVREYKWCTCKG